MSNEAPSLPGAPNSEEADILALAKERFKNAQDWESKNREKMVDDMKFAAASPDDPWQWPEAIRSFRNNDPQGSRPCLTLNYMPQHINQVINDTRQNRPSIKVLPVDDAGDVEVAKVLNGLIRHIENVSDAEVAYDTGHQTQTTAGLGYIRVCSDYCDEDSFDQEIYIKRVRNALTVYDDPGIQEPTGCDRKFLFVTEYLLEEEFQNEYPDAEPVDWELQGKGDDTGWFQNNRIRIAEYWCVEEEKSHLHLWANGKKSHGEERPEGIPDDEEPLRSRPAMRRKVMCYKITGNQVLESYEHPGRYIPFARIVGNEWYIEGELYISGIVRNAKDAQRMYNYHASQEVELTALQPRAPFVGAEGQFEGHEDKWGKANVISYAFLEYVPVVEQSSQQLLPPPQRVAPPPVQQAIMEIKRAAVADIMATMGQYGPSLGKPSNETSGRAILYRNREGDVGTFHFGDNLRRAIRFVGRIIIDLIPHIYDTRRVVRILGEDGEFDFATLDNSGDMAKEDITDEQGNHVDTIYNPSIGRYDVVVTTGPSYTTKRQEALDAMVQLVQAQPELWQVIGDLLVKNMDWPGAEQMAVRMRAMLAPAVQQMLQSQIGGETNPELLKAALAQMQMAVQQAQQAMQQLAAENADLKTKRDEKVLESQTKLEEADKRLQEALIKAHSDIEVAKVTALGNAATAETSGAGADSLKKILEGFQGAMQDHLSGIQQTAQQMMQQHQQITSMQAPVQTQERISVPASPQTLAPVPAPHT